MDNVVNAIEMTLPNGSHRLKEPVMEVETKQAVNTNSREFKQGVEAGLNSAEGGKNWQAGKELGQELRDEVKNQEPVSERIPDEPTLPIFMSDSAEGKKGNLQDEKDESEE
jgi:hypothetical protein